MSSKRSSTPRVVFLFVTATLTAIGLGLVLLDWNREQAPGLGARGDSPANLTSPSDSDDSGAGPRLEQQSPAIPQRATASVDREPNEVTAPGTAEASGSMLWLSIEPSPWLQDAEPHVTFQWTSSKDSTQDGSVPSRDGRLDPVYLGGIPRSVDQFSKVRISSLRADVLELREHQGLSPRPDLPAFELRVGLQAGASVVWDPSVPLEARVPLSLALGGGTSPPSRAVWRHDRRPGLVPYLTEIELPFQLPKLLYAESIWVCGAGLAWMAFRVEPENREVKVWPNPGVAIRVEHDLDPRDGDFFAWAMAYPSGDAERAEVKDREAVLLGPRPPGILEVWISEGDQHDSPRITHTARFEARGGESVEVDLTNAYAERNLGGLHVELTSVLEATEVRRSRVSLDLRRETQEDPKRKWSRAGQFESTQASLAASWAYEAKGLEPGNYLILVHPFALRLPVRVEAGERVERVLSLEQIGWIEVEPPSGDDGGVGRLWLRSTEVDQRERSYFSLGHSRNREGRRVWPVMPGRYAVQNLALKGGEAAYTSQPFDVVAGQVTSVALTSREQWNIAVRAISADTGEAITLDLDFWVSLRIFDAATGATHLGSTGFEGTDDAYYGCDWELDRIDAPVLIEIPEHPHWGFDELGPLLLEDGMTIEILGRRKPG